MIVSSFAHRWVFKWCNAERQHQHNKTKWHACLKLAELCRRMHAETSAASPKVWHLPPSLIQTVRQLPRPCCPALLPRTPQLPLGSQGVFAREAASGDGWCFHSERWGNAVLNWLLQHVQTSYNSGWKPAALCDHITVKLCSLMFSSRKLHSDTDSLHVYLQSDRDYLRMNQVHNVPGTV